MEPDSNPWYNSSRGVARKNLPARGGCAEACIIHFVPSFFAPFAISRIQVLSSWRTAGTGDNEGFWVGLFELHFQSK